MPADVFYPGAVDLFVNMRFASNNWYYLGSSVTAPVIEHKYLFQDVTCDRSGDAPYQKIGRSEQHVLTTTLNRVNYRTFERMRTGDDTGSKSDYKVKVGKLLFNSKDFRLFVRYAQPNAEQGRLPPDSAAKGRLYYSAKLEAYRESTVDSRAMELGLMIECNPLWYNKDRVFKFWTELDNDFPKVTLE